jgi:hypothetical protein
MSMYYTHTLIPRQFDYKPGPLQVANFFSSLLELGAAPVNPKFEVVTDAEKVALVDGRPIFEPLPRRAGRGPIARHTARRVGRNPATGEVIALPRRDYAAVKGVSGVGPELEALDEYDAVMSGEGPPRLPVVKLDPKFDNGGEPYQFDIRCRLRPVIVSMSDFHGDERTIRRIAPYGQPCDATDRTGFFSNPQTVETIEVHEAGCARFWVEFALGKWLFPKIHDNLDLLPPSIVQAAERTFQIGFNQGCHWG